MAGFPPPPARPPLPHGTLYRDDMLQTLKTFIERTAQDVRKAEDELQRLNGVMCGLTNAYKAVEGPTVAPPPYVP